MSSDKNAPMLNKNLGKEQNVPRQDAPETAKEKEIREKAEKEKKREMPSKGNKKDIPESNDPAGYDNEGNTKETPSGQRD